LLHVKLLFFTHLSAAAGREFVWLLNERLEAVIVVPHDLSELEQLAKEVFRAEKLNTHLSGPKGDGGWNTLQLQVDGFAGHDSSWFAGLAFPLHLFDRLFDAGASDLRVPDLLADFGPAKPVAQDFAVDDEFFADLEAADSLHQLDGLAALEVEERLDGGAGEEGKGSDFRVVEVLDGWKGMNGFLRLIMVAHSCAKYNYF
jgi:hypothetical protein